MKEFYNNNVKNSVLRWPHAVRHANPLPKLHPGSSRQT